MDLNLWKNKDELKKYLENLGIEYRYGCYEEKRPQICHLLGDFFLAIENKVDSAKETYQKNCDEGKFGLSCDAYGRMLIKGQVSGKPERLNAFKYFEKGCELDQPRSCYHAGQVLVIKDAQVNKEVKPNPDRGIKMLEKACLSKEQPAACTLMHTLYLKGYHDKPKNLEMAAKLGKIACHQDQYEACYNMSRMYHFGEGVEADQDMVKYYRKRTKQCMEGAKSKIQINKDVESDL